MPELIEIESKNAKIRAILGAVIVVALVLGLIAIRWQLGNMLSTLTRVSDPNVMPIAGLAIDWAPADPEGYSLKASVGETSGVAVEVLEEAVRRAPYDYLWRIEMGRAYEQDGQYAKAEFQLKKAVDLAPSYSSARWHLGNFFLRQERIDEAFTELKIAAENNPTYRDQVFSLAWDFFNKDATQMEMIAGDRPDLRARLAYFFAARGRAEDSLRNWNYLSDEGKVKNVVLARSIALGLFDQKHFPEALEFSRQFGGEINATAETVTNGSFEKNLDGEEDSRFGWLVARNDPKFEAVSDSRVKHEGNRSLRVTFKGFSKAALANIFQLVVVEPGAKYRLRFWIRTENLRSAGMPMLEIVNANDDNGIVRSEVFPTGTNAWQLISVDFTAPDNCRGVSIRTIRASCGEDCPLTGLFWYDDFDIIRL